jgi:glycosyltransferase involved in cell wall biosynthesis
LEWSNEGIIEKLENRFGVKLPGTKVVASINRGEDYDACFWVSDGSIPTLKSRNNILHFQVPFHDLGSRTLINKMKLFRIKHVVSNSQFTKSFIDKEYGVNSKVIYPPVSVNDFKPKRKQNIACYVGRFSKLTQHKRQDVLIEVFKKFYKHNKNWKLVLAGGVEIGNDNFTDELRKQAKGYPIEIQESPSYSEILELLGISKMFWSAAGYGIDAQTNPEKVEHFGITVVEAMAAKAVPLVINKGGYKEIVNDNVDGFLWSKKSDLYSKAEMLADDNKLLMRISKEAAERAKAFEQEKFIREFSKLI